jgi:nucleoside-diphosphate-sugar epimerase
MGRRVLVTGGSGYFGSLLVRRLHDDGNAVRTLDIVPPDEQPDGTEFVRADIRDRSAVASACTGIDVVFHNVAQVPLARDRALFESVNVGGTATVLAAARDARVTKVVHTSSSAIYGIPKENPVDEKTPAVPLEAYGRAKLRAEVLCREAAAAGLDVTIVRPRTILGHGRLGIFAILFEWVADGAPVFVLGRGDNRYQFVHAEDLADAIVRASGRPGPATYNVGAADFGTMRETLEALVFHAGTGSTVRSLPRKPAAVAMSGLAKLGWAPFAPYHWLLYGESLYFDISKARRELGWEPRYSNAAMIVESYEWFLANRSTLVAEGRSSHRSPVRQGAPRMLKWVARPQLRT